MKVWVDHDLCTGDGLCAEKSPAVFQMVDEISHARHTNGVLAASGQMVEVPEVEIDNVLDAAEDCPGECIFIDM